MSKIMKFHSHSQTPQFSENSKMMPFHKRDLTLPDIEMDNNI